MLYGFLYEKSNRLFRECEFFCNQSSENAATKSFEMIAANFLVLAVISSKIHTFIPVRKFISFSVFFSRLPMCSCHLLDKKRISPAINIFDKSLYEHSVSNRCRYEEVPILPQACSLCHYLLHHWHFPRLKSLDSTSTRLLADPVLHFSVTEWCLIRVGIFTQGNQSQRKPLYFRTGAQIIPQKPYPVPALRSRFSQQAANRTA